MVSLLLLREQMISYSEARAIIVSACRPLRPEKVPLLRAGGRVLRVDIKAPQNLPSFDHSAVDGYAVRSRDLMRATPSSPAGLVCVGEATAGNPSVVPLRGGQTIRIATGALLPSGADSVEKKERCRIGPNGEVIFSAPVPPASFVRKEGSEFRKGATILSAGSMIPPSCVGIIASLGFRKVHVSRQPFVNIIATGDELVGLDQRPARGHIYESSSYLLSSLLAADGAIPHLCGIAPDREKRLRTKIQRALDCDLLLITGGTSKGRHDYLRNVMEGMGVNIRVAGVRMRPGRPMVFGTYKKTLMFGLPGNPLSTYVTYHQFVRPAIRRLCGMARPVGDRVEAVMEEPYDKQDERHHFVLGIITARGGRLFVRSVGLQHSGSMAAIPRANCLISVPEHVVAVREGDLVSVEMIPGQNLFTEQIQ